MPKLLSALEASFRQCFGDIVFGMEDGTVSIFGLVLGVAAAARTPEIIIIAGASGASAAAVSMAAGVYLEAKTDRAMGRDTAPPLLRTAWMLVTNFTAAAVPILPFVLLPITEARLFSAVLTGLLLTLLGVGRAKIAAAPLFKTISETISVGAGAGIIGFLIGWVISKFYGP